MSEFEHPIRKAEVHIFAREDFQDSGVRFMARLYPYNVYPVFFTGESAEEVRQKAEDLRAEAIAKYESAYINRQEILKKARSARKRKQNK